MERAGEYLNILDPEFDAIRLLAAGVLVRAVKDVRKISKRQRAPDGYCPRELLRWFDAPVDSTLLGSLAWWAELADVSPVAVRDSVRDKLEALRARTRAA